MEYNALTTMSVFLPFILGYIWGYCDKKTK